jgi:uncharacterized protein
MTKWILFFIIMQYNHTLFAQTFADSIANHRNKYKVDFLTDKRSPITEADFPYLDFYAPTKAYRVMAKVTRIIDTIGFTMQTHSGVIKHYFVYAKLQFKLGKKNQILFIYQSQVLMKQAQYEDYLFVPFNDFTNNRTTYGGGRYLDLDIKNIANNTLELDFNKCYNPYCAFGTGFNCPIPPKENKLKIAILAGEKLFLKKTDH